MRSHDSEASLLLVDESLAHTGARHGDSAGCRWTSSRRQRRSLPPLADTRTGGDALAAILYTGGTTGRSKGVMLSHANFWTASMTRGAELNNSPESVSLLVAPLFHVAGPGPPDRPDASWAAAASPWRSSAPPRVLEAIERHGISDIIVVPSMLQSLLDDPAFHAGPRAEPDPHRLRRRAHAAGPAGPRAGRLAAGRVLPGLRPHRNRGRGVHQPAGQPPARGARAGPAQFGGPRRAGRGDHRRRRATAASCRAARSARSWRAARW